MWFIQEMQSFVNLEDYLKKNNNNSFGINVKHDTFFLSGYLFECGDSQ